ncbi:metallophosphoesterase [bacterium]|nr:metallophosphoesterase [bacterium]
MRLLASADLHGHHDVYAWLVDLVGAERPDALVLAGDLLGCSGDYDTVEEAQFADRLAVVARLSEIAVPVFYVMGNDDWIELDDPTPSHQSVHGRRVDYGEFNFVGYQYTLPFMGGVHEKPEDEIETDLAKLAPQIDHATVLVTHGPIHGALDRGILDRRAGSTSLRSVVERCAPRVHVHGHIHREFGRLGRHFNVASAGAKRAMLIDVGTMKHKVLESTV